MRARLLWSLASVVLFMGILALPRQLGPVAGWAYGAGYCLFGAALLGTVARWWRSGSPALWRPAMLSLGSLAAAGQIWIDPPAEAVVRPLDQWMVALLGLLVAAISARMIPDRLGRLWFKTERRAHDRNPGQA